MTTRTAPAGRRPLALRLAAGALALAFVGHAVHAQQQTLVITGGVAEGFTADGLRIYGETFNSGPFLWDQQPILLGGSNIVGINNAGTLAAGNDSSLSPNQAATWSGAGWNGLGGLPGGSPCGSTLSTAWDMSDNDVIVGLAWQGCTSFAFKWTAGTGMVALPTVGSSARANTISTDGQVIGGHAVGVGGMSGWFACIWDSAGVQTVIGPQGSDVTGLSSDGTYAVGNVGQDPFIWSAANGLVIIPRPVTVPVGVPDVSGYPGFGWGVTDDGTLVVGQYGNILGSVGFVWEQGVGTKAAQEYFYDAGGILFPKDAQSVTDVTGDGRTFLVNVGSWIQGGQDGYRVRLPKLFENLGYAKNGTYGKPALTAAGDLDAGTVIDVDLTAALENTGAYLVIGVAPIYLSPFYGGTLVPAFSSPFGTFITLPTNAAGELHLTAPWPGGVPSGTDLYFQYWVVDPVGVGGLSASNAVHGEVP